MDKDKLYTFSYHCRGYLVTKESFNNLMTLEKERNNNTMSKEECDKRIKEILENNGYKER